MKRRTSSRLGLIEVAVPVAIIMGLVAIGMLVVLHGAKEIVKDELVMAIITGLASVLGLYVRDWLRRRDGDDV
jgi:hypothetical protein